nr:hypothetical protein L203_05675 [Cryptococcus depauperatus CBS 7841]
MDQKKVEKVLKEAETLDTAFASLITTAAQSSRYAKTRTLQDMRRDLTKLREMYNIETILGQVSFDTYNTHIAHGKKSAMRWRNKASEICRVIQLHTFGGMTRGGVPRRASDSETG